MTRIHRRTYLRGLAASGALAVGSTAGVGSVSAGSSTDDEDDGVKSEELPNGRALVWDGDMNSSYDAEMHVVSDPTDDSSDRSGVVHITSNGSKTGDYAISMVNLGARLSKPFTLGTATADQRVSFDYYEGPENTGAAPDEVYAVVETPSKSKSKTLDELANKLYGEDFLDLEPKQQVAVDKKYRSQFDADFQSLNEISQNAFGHDYLTLSQTTLESSVTAKVYVNQFDDSKLSKDEIAQQRWDQSYESLSSTHQSQVDSLYAAQTVKGGSDAKPTSQRYLAVITVDDGVDSDSESDDEFKTFNVSKALRGSEGTWRAVPLPNSRFLSSKTVENIATRLRDEGVSFDSFVDRFGEDAELVGVGVGRGSIRDKEVLDVYYDDLTVKYPVDGDTKTKQFDFPAAVPAYVKAPSRLNSRKKGYFTVKAKLQQDEEGLDLSDVNKKSVRLTPYQPVAPSLNGIHATKVEVDGEKLIAKFPASKVTHLLGDGKSKFILSGEFDVESGSSFYGVNTVKCKGKWNKEDDKSEHKSDEKDTGDSTSDEDFVGWTTQLLSSFTPS